MGKPNGDDDDVSDELVNEVVAIMSSMDIAERVKLAPLLGLTLDELNQLIGNWKRSLP